MTMSLPKSVALAVIPGVAESLEMTANAHGNMECKAMARKVRILRVSLYVSVGIGLTGFELAKRSSEGSDGWHQKHGFIMLSGLGWGLAIGTAGYLFRTVTAIRTLRWF